MGRYTRAAAMNHGTFMLDRKCSRGQCKRKALMYFLLTFDPINIDQDKAMSRLHFLDRAGALRRALASARFRRGRVRSEERKRPLHPTAFHYPSPWERDLLVLNGQALSFCKKKTSSVMQGSE